LQLEITKLNNYILHWLLLDISFELITDIFSMAIFFVQSKLKNFYANTIQNIASVVVIRDSQEKQIT